MDVNNTRFHLLYGQDDWEPLIGETEQRSGSPGSSNLQYDLDQHALGLQPRLYKFPKIENIPLSSRRGAAADRFGNWFVITEDRTGIQVHPANGDAPVVLWPPDKNTPVSSGQKGAGFGPAEPPQIPDKVEFRGLTVTTQQYLVAGLLEPRGIVVFDLYGGGPPLWFLWPDAIAFRPFDMAPRPDGGVWILDTDPDADTGTPARFWALDRYFRVEHITQNSEEKPLPSPEIFQPDTPGSGETGERYYQSALTESMAYQVDLVRPVSIEALPDDTILLMDANKQTGETSVHRYRYDQEIWHSDPIQETIHQVIESDGSSPEAFEWLGHDMAFSLVSQQITRVPTITGTLYFVGQDGNQSFAFSVVAGKKSVQLQLQDKYLPLRRFQGKGLTAYRKTVYYDMPADWVPVTEQPKPRYHEQGILETSLENPLDGRIPGCVWHRILLDARIPVESEVTVESRAADSPQDLAQTSWREEPALYRRGTGSELPYYRPFSAHQEEKPGIGTWEALFQHATGRYLQLRLTLRGNSRLTPRIFALRVYYPRFSYLKEYLPAVYQEDESSASFLDRFLANLEGTYTEIEGKIAQAEVLFDERSIPPEYLNWLSSWFGTVLDPTYSDEKRRLFIRHAMELYRQRGTLAGLIRSLRLLLDPCPDDTLFQSGGIALDLGMQEQELPGAQILRHNIRIIERYRVRQIPGVVFGDPTAIEETAVSNDLSNWTPAQGSEPLQEEFRQFLQQIYPDQASLGAVWATDATTTFRLDQVLFSPVPPSDEQQRQDWRQFIREFLGFTYAEPAPEDVVMYRKYLARTYRQISRLNESYLTAYTSFSDVNLPGERDFPGRNPRLHDWIRFVSQILPLERSAHRFDVLIPVEPGTEISAQNERLSLVRRIVEQEKPGHTEFDVKPYWAAFRVGAARIGYDTLLDEGSRYVAILLGQSYLAQGYLGYPASRESAGPVTPWCEQPDSGRRL